MDIKIPTEKKLINPQKIWISGAVLVAITLSLWIMSQPSGADQVAKNQIWTGTVKRGNLALEVEGYGKLKSKQALQVIVERSISLQEFVNRYSDITQNITINKSSLLFLVVFL